MQSFEEGTRELGERIGHGDLVGRVEVDQIYACPQHEGYWLTGPLAGHLIKNHPQGGKAHYLSEPLHEGAGKYFQILADSVLGHQDGPRKGMEKVVEDLALQVWVWAPREFEDLRNSAHPSVESDGAVVYDRPPERARLSKGALAEKSKRRALGEGPRAGGPEIPFRG